MDVRRRAAPGLCEVLLCLQKIPHLQPIRPNGIHGRHDREHHQTIQPHVGRGPIAAGQHRVSRKFRLRTKVQVRRQRVVTRPACRHFRQSNNARQIPGPTRIRLGPMKRTRRRRYSDHFGCELGHAASLLCQSFHCWQRDSAKCSRPLLLQSYLVATESKGLRKFPRRWLLRRTGTTNQYRMEFPRPKFRPIPAR